MKSISINPHKSGHYCSPTIYPQGKGSGGLYLSGDAGPAAREAEQHQTTASSRTRGGGPRLACASSTRPRSAATREGGGHGWRLVREASSEVVGAREPGGKRQDEVVTRKMASPRRTRSSRGEVEDDEEPPLPWQAVAEESEGRWLIHPK